MNKTISSLMQFLAKTPTKKLAKEVGVEENILDFKRIMDPKKWKIQEDSGDEKLLVNKSGFYCWVDTNEEGDITEAPLFMFDDE